jgi:Protein of unknown function (DUF2934)
MPCTDTSLPVLIENVEPLSPIDPMRPSEERPVTRHEEVAQRAYEIYESRGRTDGADADDWLQAERDIPSQQTQAS